MKKEIIALILIILISLSFGVYPAKAKSEQGTLKTGGILGYKVSGFDFSISLNYSLNYTMNYNDEINRGDYNDIRILLQGGQANLTLTIGNNTIYYNRTIKLGEEFTTDINIFSFSIVLRAEAPINVAGEASSSSNSLIFENESAQIVRLKVSDAANIGETINVTLPFKLQLYFSLIRPIPTPIIKIGEIPMSPVLKAQFKVTENWLNRNLYYIILIIIIAVIVTTIAIFYIRRRTRKS